MSIAFLFPGLGSQRPGMLHRLPDTAASATVLAEADWALRQPAPRAGGAGKAGTAPDHADGIAELDTEEALRDSPVACHVALLVAGVAGARALLEDEGVRPTVVAGHGVGGYAAAVVAQVLTFEEALRAVRLRGDLLARGEEDEADVAIRLAQHLATVKRRPQGVAYASGVHGRCLRGETNAVFDDLAQSVARPVRWAEATAGLPAEGIACCVEVPPGRALTERMRAELPALAVVSVEEHGIAEAGELARAAMGGTQRPQPAPYDADEGADEGADGGADGDVPPGWGGVFGAGRSGLA